ncbi:MAG: tetratricopeptide repeat protein, partial [Deltaproteobacteria bacterium]|nr:tetratricopeptide repeat protein [Deltaproteobacteria bacterium]
MKLLILLFVLSGCAANRTAVSPAESPSEQRNVQDYLVSQMEFYEAHPAAALARLNKVLNRETASAHLWSKRAMIKISLNDLEGAASDLQTALQFEPDAVDHMVLLGQIDQSLGRMAEARAIYEKAYHLRPDYEEVLQLLVNLHLAQNNDLAAVDLLREWSLRHPDETEPLFNLAFLYHSRLRDSKKATLTYRKILRQSPSDLRALSSLAGIYLETGHEREAFQVLKTIRQTAPADLNVSLKIALIYYEAKKYDEAIQTFREVLALSPNLDRVIYYLGVVLENVKRDEEALHEFSRIPQDSGFFKDARIHSAFLLQGANERAEAIELLTQTIVLKPKES